MEMGIFAKWRQWRRINKRTRLRWLLERWYIAGYEAAMVRKRQIDDQERISADIHRAKFWAYMRGFSYQNKLMREEY